MSKKRAYIIFMLVFLFFIVLNFSIHVYRTNRFNSKTFTIDKTEEEHSFSLTPTNGNQISWTRTANIGNETVDLYACSYEGIFLNDSGVEVADWTLRVNIEGECYLNSAWCGLVEIHQFDGDRENVQTLDLRDLANENIRLNHYLDGDIYLFPLNKGDYIIYYPDEEAKEIPLKKIGISPAEAGIGIIIYWDQSKEHTLSDYTVTYQNHKSYFQGTESILFLVLSGIWIILLVGGISTVITIHFMKEKTEMELTKKHNEMLNEEVHERTAQILHMQHKVVMGLADFIENRDSNTGGHVKRTSDVIRILVDEIRRQGIMNIDGEKATDIVRAAPMHDLGKIAVDDCILSKPGKLTDEEFAIMKTHAAKSGEIVKLILEDVEEKHFVNTAFNIARHHHEKWDGRGYPDGLKGEDIPVEARIMTVADIYDALVSKRCYKEPMSFEEANKIMREGMGSTFDPQLEPVFVACRPLLEKYYKTDINYKE